MSINERGKRPVSSDFKNPSCTVHFLTASPSLTQGARKVAYTSETSRLPVSTGTGSFLDSTFNLPFVLFTASSLTSKKEL